MSWGRLHTTTLAARWLPADFVRATATGGLFTLVTYFLMLCVFSLELKSFLQGTFTTEISLDRSAASLLQINFDIDVHDIECKNLRVVVFSQDGEEPLKMMAKDFWLRTIDQKGRPQGVSSRPPDEEHQLAMKTLQAGQGQPETDSDFRSDSFDAVIKKYDFTLINFFTRWCTHCEKFAPTWSNLDRKLTGGADGGESDPKLLPDQSGQMKSVRPTKMNCEEFRPTCHAIGIDAFPTIRLYKRDGTYVLYEGDREEDDIYNWVAEAIKKSVGWTQDNEAFERGCNVRGRLQVPRVPGHLELMSGTGNQDLEPSLANVSHLVKHLSFSDPDDGTYHRKLWSRLPREISANLNPVDGKSYATKAFHTAWQHDFKVVGTLGLGGQIFYQFSHHHRVATFDDEALPQARFYYDIEPFSVSLRNTEKRWYNFITSVLAVTGGTFVLMRLMSMGTLGIVEAVKPTKKRRLAGHLDASIY